MKLLITGGCGFVGANLLERISQKGGYKVRVLDNESLGRRAWIGEFDAEFIKGDVQDRATVGKAVAGMDAIIHLAALTRVMDSIEDPRLCFESNARGTFELLMAARDAGIKRFVNASTGGAILGEAEPPIHEEMVPRPLAPYGAAKVAGEALCGAFTASYGLPTVSLRFSNIYGPRSFHKGSVVALVFRQVLRGKPVTIYGDGSQTRDYVFVRDLSDAILNAVHSKANGVFQLGAGKPTTLTELLDLVDATIGPERKVERRYEDFRAGEVKHTYTDVTKARRALGFAPATSLKDGLKETWAWFGDNERYFAGG